MTSRKEMIEHLREHYGLTLNETMEFLNLPLHPASLRDDFAKAALIGLCSMGDTVSNAQRAYEIADTMLEERLK
jgi:hypothetical protein